MTLKERVPHLEIEPINPVTQRAFDRMDMMIDPGRKDRIEKLCQYRESDGPYLYLRGYRGRMVDESYVNIDKIHVKPRYLADEIAKSDAIYNIEVRRGGEQGQSVLGFALDKEGLLILKLPDPEKKGRIKEIGRFILEGVRGVRDAQFRELSGPLVDWLDGNLRVNSKDNLAPLTTDIVKFMKF